MLKSPALFQFMVEHADAIAHREPAASGEAIRQSVLLHLDHITRGGDPFEMLEARPLDFGHWSAHKLEALTDYGLRHGEAVGIGVALDTLYSHLKLGLDREVADQTLDVLQRLNLPIYDAALSEEAVFDGLEEFRQHLGGELTITLLTSLASPSMSMKSITLPCAKPSLHSASVRWLLRIGRQKNKAQNKAASARRDDVFMLATIGNCGKVAVGGLAFLVGKLYCDRHCFKLTVKFLCVQ